MPGRPIRTARGPISATFGAPPSKSVTHRALLTAALASGPSSIVRPLEADDTRVTRDGLVALGIDVRDVDGTWRVDGRGGEVPGGGSLYLDQSGTSLRFLLALAALGARPSRLDGAPRLRERPVQELASVIEDLGGRVSLSSDGAGLPLEAGGSPVRGGRVELDAGKSSQFASAMLLVASRLPGGLELTLRPPVVSLPYVELTAQVIEQFGAAVCREDPLRWRVSPGDYPGRTYRVEGDHSSASYFMAAVAVVGGKARIEDLSPQSRQPDSRLAAILEQLGCRVQRGGDWIEVQGDGRIPPFELDLSEAPDLVPTLAVLALFSEGACTIGGVPHLRLKESDRLAVLAGNLSALGRPTTAGDDRLVIGPPRSQAGATIRTASDHRMAMAFAVAGLKIEGVVIDDPGCVAKSNPSFWTQFERLEG